MKVGKSITLFLINGLVDGVVACELLNWTGKGYKIPRNHLKELSGRAELKKTGVYFLVGRDDSDSETVYIGESEEVYKRLLQHIEKDYWTECLVFISKDENLNKAHIKYLECMLYKMAIEAGRFKVINNNIPTSPAISEADQAVMTEYGSNLRLLVGALGYKIFYPLINIRIQKQNKYIISAARAANASAVLTSEGMVVLKGSIIATSEVPSAPKAVITKRDNLKKEKVVDKNIFTKDYLFSSPSIAAAVVMGRNANGLIEWKKADDGSTLKDNQPKSEDEG